MRVTTFAVSLILASVFWGHLPDRFGGAGIALYCLVIQAIGLGIIGFARSARLAISGAAICGAGFSLVFPSLGTRVSARCNSMSGRAKMVRAEFVEKVKQSEHWQHQAMVPSELEEGVTIWA